MITQPALRFSLPFLIFAALACGARTLSAAPIVIDNFSDNLAPTSMNTFVDGSMLGGELDIGLNLLEAATFEISGGIGTLSGVTETSGANNVKFIYDGEDNATAFAFGLPNVDFTGGGSNDRFVIDLTDVTGTIDVAVSLYNDTGGFASELTITGVTEAGILEFPFADFIDIGEGADFTSSQQIGIIFYLDTGEGFAINSFIAIGTSSPTVTVPDNSAPTLKLSAKSRLKTPLPRHAIKGTVSDNDAVARVEIKGKGSRYEAARLKPSGKWIFRTPRLKPGNNVFLVRAFDVSGDQSAVQRVRVKGR